MKISDNCTLRSKSGDRWLTNQPMTAFKTYLQLSGLENKPGLSTVWGNRCSEFAIGENGILDKYYKTVDEASVFQYFSL